MESNEVDNISIPNKVWQITSAIAKFIAVLALIFALVASIIFSNERKLINDRLDMILSQSAWRNTDNIETIAQANMALSLSKLPTIFYDKQIKALYGIEYINTSYNIAMATTCIQTPINNQSETEVEALQETINNIKNTADWYNANVFPYSNTSIYLNNLGNTIIDIDTQMANIISTMQNSDATYEELKIKVLYELGNSELEKSTDSIFESLQELYMITAMFTGVRIILLASIIYVTISLAALAYGRVKRLNVKEQ